MNPTTVLIIEDEPMLRLTMGDHMRDRGWTVLEAADGPQGLALLAEHSPDVVTLDLRMSPMDGHEVLAAIREQDTSIPVIIVSGQGQMQDLILALRAGATDYLQKPIENFAILDHAIDQALERVALRRGNRMLSQSFLASGPQQAEHFAEILTTSGKMVDIFRYCEAVAQTGQPVLITGETGAGKELLAKAIHRSSRLAGQFVAVNVAGLDEQSFSDTLFGHLRGAFTGADRPREGLIEKAAGGTLFLDEVGDLPPAAQIRLLRVLQEREYYPLGSDVPRPMRARILAATNKPLQTLRRDPAFRSDFFYRLTTHSLEIPPLRERREDIPYLLDHFLADSAAAQGKPTPELSPGISERLKAHPFPGNVRELKAMAQDALSRWHRGPLTLEHFPSLEDGPLPEVSSDDATDAICRCDVLPTLREAQDCLIAEALRRTGGVQRSAAALLGITPQSLNERLKRKQS